MAFGARRAAVFVDRDGVICENRVDHVKSWAEFVFIPGAIEALASLSRTGVPVFILTNQSVVGRGIITMSQLQTINNRMLSILASSGAKIEDVLVCPHHPDDHCVCRKPQIGLFQQAEKDHKIDLERSFFIGDAATDVEAGARAGCATVLVRTGRGAATIESKSWGEHKPDFIADDVVDAAIWILGRKALDFGTHAEVGS